MVRWLTKNHGVFIINGSKLKLDILKMSIFKINKNTFFRKKRENHFKA